MAQVDIAMPTYNCADWIDGFLASLLAQDFTDWRLIARDDASTDSTSLRLAHWQRELGGKMVTLPDSGNRNLGLIDNYSAVFAASTARWVMSADPDDVWLPGKITRTLRAMQEIEAASGQDTPAAVCTDATVVDQDRQPVAPSFWRWARIDPRFVGILGRTAMESAALGSTMMVNRPLLDRALPIEHGAAYQDFWLSLVAAAFGRMVALPDRTILYRRHQINATIAPYCETISGAIRKTIHAPAGPKARLEKLVAQSARQAHSFLKRYRANLRGADILTLEAVEKLPSMSALQRRIAVWKYGLWFGSPLKNAGLMALL